MKLLEKNKGEYLPGPVRGKDSSDRTKKITEHKKFDKLDFNKIKTSAISLSSLKMKRQDTGS